MQSHLDEFGHASGLCVNMAKSTAVGIRCPQEDLKEVWALLGFTSGAFPCKYLGLPLTIHKQSAAQLQVLVAQLANCLTNLRAKLMTKSGRLILITSVLCAIPIHAMLALDLPPKTISTMVRICRGFLWCGKKEAIGGNCSVAWDIVGRPK